MRIVYVYDAIYPYVTGGAERRYHELGTRLAKRGHEVQHVGWQYWPGAAQRLEHGVLLHGAGAPPPLHDASGRRTFREALQFAIAATRIVARLDADIIDCSSIPYLPPMLLSCTARVRRVPVAVSWHEFMGERWSGYFPGTPGRARLAQFVEQLSARFGTHRIAVSAFTRQRLPSGPSLTVIENGVDCDSMARLTPADDAPDVVFAGRLVPHKRADLLLEALALLPGVTGGIFGEGPERPRLERRIADLNLAERVKCFGRLPSAESVYRYFKGAKAVLVPSLQEGFGMTVLEAQAAGTAPVVVRAEHSAASELVSDGIDGLVTGDAPADIAWALQRLVSQPAVRARLGRNAMAAARRYDWDVLAVRAEELYASMLRSPAGLTRELERAA